jgi:RNA polymerase sigma-70 factor, ECF subfamily
MPHQGTGFTKTESHSGAAQGDRYLNCETALNYETALLECASGSQSAVGKIYAREVAGAWYGFDDGNISVAHWQLSRR